MAPTQRQQRTRRPWWPPAGRRWAGRRWAGRRRAQDESRGQEPRRPGLLRESPRFRYLWLSRTISATGTGLSRVALVLLVAPSGPGAVSLVLLCSMLPQLL